MSDAAGWCCARAYISPRNAVVIQQGEEEKSAEGADPGGGLPRGLNTPGFPPTYRNVADGSVPSNPVAAPPAPAASRIPSKQAPQVQHLDRCTTQSSPADGLAGALVEPAGGTPRHPPVSAVLSKARMGTAGERRGAVACQDPGLGDVTSPPRRGAGARGRAAYGPEIVEGG